MKNNTKVFGLDRELNLRWNNHLIIQSSSQLNDFHKGVKFNSSTLEIKRFSSG